eukprot:Clim_evm12s153 gene=Clim_evmTU12s153
MTRIPRALVNGAFKTMRAPQGATRIRRSIQTTSRQLDKEFESVRGMHDSFGMEEAATSWIGQQFSKTVSGFGYEHFNTPMVEQVDVYKKSLGMDSDIVLKEMFHWTDQGEKEVCLRPEGTAGVARAVVQHRLFERGSLKLWYNGPMFRRERPQKGRYRQFRQFGIEHIGPEHPIADAEAIACAWKCLEAIRVTDHCKLLLHTLGDSETRSKYIQQLTEYLTAHKDRLSTASLTRLQANAVLRILDSKDLGDQELLKEGAPKILEHAITDSSRAHFNAVCNGLDVIGIPYEIDHHLVRGLDYYTGMVFEVIGDGLGSSQTAVLAGGRYNDLLHKMGAPRSLPAVGWAAGVDRLRITMTERSNAWKDEAAKIEDCQHKGRIALVLTHDNSSAGTDPVMAAALKAYENAIAVDGISLHILGTGSMKKQLKKAENQLQASASIVIGPREAGTGSFLLKNFRSKSQSEHALNDVQEVLTQLLRSP